MSKGIAILVFLAMGIILPFSTTEAQSSLITPNQELLYTRQVTESQAEYVSLSASDRQVFSLPQYPDCWRISRNGSYVALSSLDAQTALVIRRLDTAEIILQATWQASWRPCSIIWLTDTALSIARSDVVNASFRYEISGGTLIPISYTPGQLPALPEFPEQFQQSAIPQFVLRSPQPNVFTYYRCIGQTFPDGYQQCPGGIAVVIYDAANQTFVGELYRPDPYLSGFDVSRERSVGWEKIAWSADGRYLAYASVTNISSSDFDLAIRDLTTNQDLDLDFPNETVEYDVALTWSPVGHKLLFWLWGRLGEGYIGDDDDILRHPIIFDADQQQFVWTENPYEFPPNYFGDPVQWSPDGLAFVFTDAAKNLIHVNALTGATALLDTNVTTIIDWVELEQAQPTLPPPTPVPTATPPPPLVANAGEDQFNVIYVEDCQFHCPPPEVLTTWVTLDGSDSSGAITAYEWTRSGQVVSTQVSFTTDLGPGGYEFALKVSNASGYATDSVTIVVATCEVETGGCSALVDPGDPPEE